MNLPPDRRPVRWLPARNPALPPRPRRMRLEALEPRCLLNAAGGLDAAVEFLIESADLYALSDNPDDLGNPIVPLYTDYWAGGTYGEVDDTVRVEVDGNDPDAARGLSSFRVTWDGSGANGYFQFGIGTGQANRPRELPEFGQAHAVRFFAKGDTDGQQVAVHVFRTDAGDGWTQLETSPEVVTLSTEWQSVQVDLPAGIAPSELHAVQFVLGDGLSSGGGTFWLDEVRINTDGYDPLRVLQSYRPGDWAPTDSALTTVEGRDVYIYPNLASLYDNALAIRALLASGDANARTTALDVADAVLATALPDGSYDNLRNSGHVLHGDGTPRPYYPEEQSLGDNSWFGLALVDVYRATGESSYLEAAKAISDWAESNLKAEGPLGGYRGGFDTQGAAFPWRATEHNIDLFALNRQLAVELAALEDPAAATYAGRARHAGDFVMAMFDDADGKFWAGTLEDDTINTDSIPLDAQLWSLLALGQCSPYATAVDWTRPLAWAQAHLQRTDGAYSGFTFSTDSTPGKVWLEGTAQAATAYAALGQTAEFGQALDVLELARTTHPRGDGQGLVASSSAELEDPTLGAVYDDRLHTGATAWSALARMEVNPLAPAGVESFGAITFHEQADLDPSSADLWYWGHTTHEAFLTLEATPEDPSDDVQVALYDADLSQLAVSAPAAGSQRIDWPSDAGETYYVRLSGESDDVRLRVANLVDQGDNSMIVHGTETDDLFEFQAHVEGGGESQVSRVTINGLPYEYTSPAGPSPPEFLAAFDGGGGSDQATLTGWSGDDSATLYANFATLGGQTYEVQVSDVSSITAVGGGGSDTAELYDAESDDQLVASPVYARMFGQGFDNQIWDFDQVTAYADAAGEDVARLYDSAGDDQFTGTPQYASLSGAGFEVRAEEFDAVDAFATAGGSDQAELQDSDGDDVFYASPVEAALSGAGFRNRVKFFETVGGQATMGFDQAQLYDSAGDDDYLATPSYAALTGDGLELTANGFDEVTAHATAGGQDTAKLYDSPGHDMFVGTPVYGALYGEGFYNRTWRFDAVHAYATAGGFDRTKMFDSRGDDQFYAEPEEGALYGEEYYIRAKHFEQVHAYATAGGRDTAQLVGSAEDEIFYASPKHGALYRPYVYYNRAKHFEEVYARGAAEDATETGSDQAELHDAALDDFLEAEGDWASLANQDVDSLPYKEALSLYRADDFDHVKAIGTTGTNKKEIREPVDFVLELEGTWEDL